jgi:hypothetical protein
MLIRSLVRNPNISIIKAMSMIDVRSIFAKRAPLRKTPHFVDDESVAAAKLIRTQREDLALGAMPSTDLVRQRIKGNAGIVIPKLL